MTKSGTWPGGVAMESLSNMDSAGSCDSVISVNSGCSEDSMEHLSAEERACLIYLEEMIEALDVELQEDSGLSNDEPDSGHLAGKMAQMNVEDISSFKSDESRKDQKPLPTVLAPSPAEPGSGALTDEDKAERQARSLTSDPASTAAFSPINVKTQPKPPVAAPASSCKVSPPASPTESAQSTKASAIDLDLIPPPSDFMDKPDPPPQLQERKPLPPLVVTPTNRPAAEVPAGLNPATVSYGPPMSPPLEPAEPRSPPAVAPKPKKLPANIILKSHKASVPGSDGNLVHSIPVSPDRPILDPRRVHTEALRKLGLLKSEDTESGPVLSPVLSPKTRKSWASPPPPPPKSPMTPPSTPSYTYVNSTPPAPVSVQSSTPAAPVTSAASPTPFILPAPPAFSDRRLSSDIKVSAVKGVLEATVNASPARVKSVTPSKKTGVKSATLERSGLGLSSFMSTQESTEAPKGTSREQSLSQLRQNRPRPASLGSRKEFSNGQGEGSTASKHPDLGTGLPVQAAFQFPRDSQKLPRSQGISVLICPRGENGDNRREALKKLGLLRD